MNFYYISWKRTSKFKLFNYLQRARFWNLKKPRVKSYIYSTYTCTDAQRRRRIASRSSFKNCEKSIVKLRNFCFCLFPSNFCPLSFIWRNSGVDTVKNRKIMAWNSDDLIAPVLDDGARSTSTPNVPFRKIFLMRKSLSRNAVWFKSHSILHFNNFGLIVV